MPTDHRTVTVAPSRIPARDVTNTNDESGRFVRETGCKTAGNSFRQRRADPFRVGGTRPVGSDPPNGYGLHNITGNVWE